MWEKTRNQGSSGHRHWRRGAEALDDVLSEYLEWERHDDHGLPR